MSVVKQLVEPNADSTSPLFCPEFILDLKPKLMHKFVIQLSGHSPDVYTESLNSRSPGIMRNIIIYELYTILSDYFLNITLHISEKMLDYVLARNSGKITLDILTDRLSILVNRAYAELQYK